MIKIGIIDDNLRFTDLLNEYLDMQDDMKVVGVANNGVAGMELIKKQQPDLIILDIIMPYTDGLSLLETLYNEKNPAKVLFLTSFGSEDIITKANEFGATYFLLKPVDFSVLSDKIRSIFVQKSYKVVSRKEEEVRIKENERKSDDIEIRVSNTLHKIGVPPNLKGYLFLREAIQMVVGDADLLGGNGGITNVIYPTIAKKFHTTPTRVERGMRHAIEVGWNRSEAEMVKQIFGNTISQLKKKPTNGKFIALLSEYLRVQN